MAIESASSKYLSAESRSPAALAPSPRLFNVCRSSHQLPARREIAADSRALAGKVRDNSITPPELSGGTFTVSNLGMYGVTNFSAVINAPQAAIRSAAAPSQDGKS